MPRAQVRQKPLGIPLNEEERSLVDRAAGRNGCRNTSAWGRQEILRRARRVVEKASDGRQL